MPYEITHWIYAYQLHKGERTGIVVGPCESMPELVGKMQDERMIGEYEIVKTIVADY